MSLGMLNEYMVYARHPGISLRYGRTALLRPDRSHEEVQAIVHQFFSGTTVRIGDMVKAKLMGTEIYYQGYLESFDDDVCCLYLPNIGNANLFDIKTIVRVG